MSALSRRKLLRTFPLDFLATAALPAVVDMPQADPTGVVDRTKAWQEAYLASLAAANAYSASLRVKPLKKTECDRCFAVHVAACEVLEAERSALWRV
ncbi:hypothetical protein RFM68_24400 [Mesorhizobium sp. MSK_1335]|uniref:Uncharacterized protein n=1 Tax=Mesorhizobium montanum TaxID=3072323 RepID=A0ABU4ZRI3_9HYPH|nr:hypothetical protein [Mesorhizobium sp. MSK_1335]MDX8527647.1 hypothetical protein [Mesorhizobium sp. MSK_1335]